MPKDSLKDNLDGNELDLSLNNLSVVPVKELMTIPKATHLDLSCNVLISLPDGFCNLQHLVKIDLSKNHLTSLPTKFGSLTNLQHLDLLGNQLEKLPLSFCHLEKLKWLDLKDNPLDAGLKKAAGDCLDETQCRKCAKSVLAYMKTVSSEAERKKQKQLQEQREREAAEKKKEDEERERKKAEKKAEREKRKQQHQAKQEQELAEKKEARVEKSDKSEVCNGPPTKARTVQKKSCLGSCCFWIFAVLILALAVTVGVHVYCNENKGHDLCKTHYVPVMNQAHAKYEKLRVYVETFTKEQFRKETVSDSPRHDTKDTKNTRDTDDTDETF